MGPEGFEPSHVGFHLLFPEDVGEKYVKPRHSIIWIKRNVAPHHRIQIGRTCAWFERDIESWLESLRPRD